MWNRREISARSYHDRSHYLHPHPYACVCDTPVIRRVWMRMMHAQVATLDESEAAAPQLLLLASEKTDKLPLAEQTKQGFRVSGPGGRGGLRRRARHCPASVSRPGPHGASFTSVCGGLARTAGAGWRGCLTIQLDYQT
jgi:hypothetical protein